MPVASFPAYTREEKNEELQCMTPCKNIPVTLHEELYVFQTLVYRFITQYYNLLISR